MDKKPIVLTEKISIGISACCMGCPVRYNGKGIDVLQSLGREKNDFIWNPVCPESMAGLGVPRDPVHLSGGTGYDVYHGEARVKNRAKGDVTQQMKQGCQSCLEALERSSSVAFVYMEGSPSCGVYRTSLKNQKRGNPPGLFGSLLLEKGYFLIPSKDMQSPLKWWDWRRRLLAFHWFSSVSLVRAQDMYEVWHTLKFLCQELNNSWARNMGNSLAHLPHPLDPETIATFKKELIEVLRSPSTTTRITNSLWKHYAHYRKVRGKTVPEIHDPEYRRNITSIAQELLQMERVSVDEEYLFGASPVIYRDLRRLKKNSNQ